MKPSQFQSRLSALVAEAVEAQISPVTICNELQRHFAAVSRAARQVQHEQTTHELTEKICVNPSRSSK